MKFQFQVSTISRGYDAAGYFAKDPGRFISMHVQGWSAEAKKVVPLEDWTAALCEVVSSRNARSPQILRSQFQLQRTTSHSQQRIVGDWPLHCHT